MLHHRVNRLFLKVPGKAVEFYKSVGQTSAKMFSVHLMPISNEYVIAKTHWGVAFEKTGDEMIEFDISYVAQTALPEPKIILAIAHEDEDDAMKNFSNFNSVSTIAISVPVLKPAIHVNYSNYSFILQHYCLNKSGNINPLYFLYLCNDFYRNHRLWAIESFMILSV